MGKEKLQIGDVVVLNSGGRDMTITEIKEDIIHCSFWATANGSSMFTFTSSEPRLETIGFNHRCLKISGTQTER